MRKKLALIFAVLLGASGMVSTTASAISFNIDIGDRPYYLRGPGYWDGGVYYVWYPGYWEWRHHRKVWHHGYYQPRHRGGRWHHY